MSTSRKRIIAIVAVILLVAISMTGCQDEPNQVDLKRSDEAEDTSASLRARIQKEIQALPDHEWAGNYYHGDGLGVNVSLILAPKAGFLFEWHGCLGLYDRNYGMISYVDNKIKLSLTFINERKGFQGIAEEFTSISWGARKYLIPSDDIIGFCNAVNSGLEPRYDMHGFFLLRDGDENKEVSEFPNVPQVFSAYLLKEPIKAEIIAVGQHALRQSLGEWNFKDTHVTLDVGTENGLLEGMKLHVFHPDDCFEEVIITKIERNRSEGIMRQSEEDASPKVGWKLSTKEQWRMEYNEIRKTSGK